MSTGNLCHHWGRTMTTGNPMQYDSHFVDCGTSGGVWGWKRACCLMIGGRGRTTTVGTAPHGQLHCDPGGEGHFMKMVHNGVECGMMAAVAQGIPAPVTTAAINERSDSRGLGKFTVQLLSAMRSDFGGHVEKEA